MSQLDGLSADALSTGETRCYFPNCEKPACAKNKFCETHKNACASLQAQVWRGWQKKEELSEEQQEWRQVFGQGKACPGKPAEAEAVLDAWLEDHPDENKEKDMKLSAYSHLYTTCQNHGFVTRKPYLDKEQFLALIVRDRPNWTLDRAEAEWNTIADTPGVGVAYEGPAGSELQLECPSWCLSGSMACYHDTYGNEAKHFAHKTPAQQMDEKTRAASMAEMSQGFKRSLNRVSENTRSEIQKRCRVHKELVRHDAGYIKSLFDQHAGLSSGMTTPTRNPSESGQGFQSSPRGSAGSADPDIQSPTGKKVAKAAYRYERFLMSKIRLCGERMHSHLTKKERATRQALEGCSKELAKGDILDDGNKPWYNMALERYKAGVCMIGNSPMQLITDNCIGNEKAFEQPGVEKAVAASRNTETLRRLLTAMPCTVIERSESALNVLEMRMEIEKSIMRRLLWTSTPSRGNINTCTRRCWRS